MPNKYHDKSTISSYFQRQYEPYIRFSPDHDITDNRPYEIPPAKNQTEIFYRTILGLSEPHLARNDLVLDLGCALGRLSAEYAQRTKHVFGLDHSAVMIATAKRIVTSGKMKTISIPLRIIGNDYVDAYINGWGISNCDFVIADAGSIPFEDQLFDFVAAVNLLDRVKSPGLVVPEIRRVLKSNGRLLITSPYDWRKLYTPNEKEWIRNLKTLFTDNHWTVLNELDGIPSLTKIHQRALSLTITHMLVLEKR